MRPSDVREALLAEAIGDVGRVMRDVAALAPLMAQSRADLVQASAELRASLEGFESRMNAITDHAKTQTVKYMATKADELARRAVDQQVRTMGDAARIALGSEIGTMMQRWQASLQSLLEQRRTRFGQTCMTHLAAAVLGAATWALAARLGYV